MQQTSSSQRFIRLQHKVGKGKRRILQQGRASAAMLKQQADGMGMQPIAEHPHSSGVKVCATN